MRKVLACAVLAAALLPGVARATPITVTVTADGGAPQTFTGTDSFALAGQTFGVFNLNSINVLSAPLALALPSVLDSNTLDTNTTSADGNPHTLAIDVVGFFTGAIPGTRLVTSSFDTTGLTTGWSVQETTDVNDITLATFNFTATPTVHANAADDDTNGVVIGSSFTASEHFLITTNGTVGQANNGIEMTVQGAPGPQVGSGLAGLFMVIGMVFLAWRKGGLSFMPS